MRMPPKSPVSPRLVACAGLALLCLAASVRAGEEDDPGAYRTPEILELKDEALIARIWETIHGDSIVPPGEYQVLLPPAAELTLPGGEQDAGAYLLRDGTMEGRLDRTAWEQAAAFSRQDKVVRWKEDWEEPESEYIPTLWKAFALDQAKLLRWTEWPAGFRFSMASAVSVVPSANPQFEQQMEFAWNQKLFRHFLLGAGLRRSEYGGGLVKTFRTSQVTGVGADTVRPGFWTEPYWGWTLSAGVPGVRYTMHRAERPLPDWFWLETRADTLIQTKKAGKVVRQWTDTASLALDGNVAHSLALKLGYARYRLHWDGDAYATVVQAFELDELPAFFGNWGIGYVTAGGVAATRAWLDFADFGFSLARPAAWPSRFRFAFLHLDVAYRSLKNYSLGVSLAIRLENPVMNLPGAAP